MMQAPLPLTRELVLIGGGHTHALVLRRWGMAPMPGVRLTLINPGPSAPYTGMLPGHIAGHYARDELSIDLVRLARFAGARLIVGAVTGIERDARQIHVTGRPPVAYDIASINVGISSDLPSLPGFTEFGVGAKPLGRYAADWQTFREAVRAGHRRPEIAVIGAGVGGAELAMAMAHALQQDGVKRPLVTVIEKAAALPGLRPATRAAVLANMARLGIVLREHAAPDRITADAVLLQDGTRVAAMLVVGTAGARPQDWLADTGLTLNAGFISVDPSLRSVSDPAIYAVGDCADLGHAPRPKAGVFAVREAPVLYHNLRADLTGGARQRFRPQRDYLKLISLGGKSAVADKFALRSQGAWLWRLKDRIDRKFMRKFIDLPVMPAPELPPDLPLGLRETLRGAAPLCGGCGAKVGGATLGAVLADLPAAGRDDILSRPGDDAAVLRVGDAQQVITTDHLRAFTQDPWMQARIAAVHALGDIWAMGAAPHAALATVILPRMEPAMQQVWLAEIMAAATGVFAQAGAEIVGGHTSLGAELTIGFTVTGLLEDRPITLAGARPGDILLLSKPIGSGTILAGEMALKARGDWVVDALAEMARPQGDAANALRAAHAMTDVTGFGLAGHLMAICQASGLAAELDLEAIPLMAGALELAEMGVRSTIYPENRQVAARMSLPDGPRTDLLFDPQTAGGLLASVAAAEAGAALACLRDQGIAAARIGRLVEGAPFITVR